MIHALFPSLLLYKSLSQITTPINQSNPKNSLQTPRHYTTIMHLKQFLSFSHPPHKTLHPSPTFPTPSAHTSGDISDSKWESIIQTADPIITKWDPQSSDFNKITFLFRHGRHESQQFLTTVTNLRHAMHYLVAQNSPSTTLILAQKLMQIAMTRLEKEFYQILTENRDYLDPESVSGRSTGSGEAPTDNETEVSGESATEVDRVSVAAMADLRSIADCMISSGYGKECVKIYKVIRKSIIDETLYRLGTERFRSSRVQRMNWDTTVHVIKNWINAVRVAVNSLFRGEKILCDHVFARSATIRDSCFSETTKEGAITLFKFPEMVAKTKKESEKIFVLMELYELYLDISSEIELIFNSESTAAVRDQSQAAILKLGDSIRSILSEFEATIQKDSSRTPVAGGGVHPLTRSAMSFISSLSDYSAVISELIPNSPIPSSYIESLANDDVLTSPATAHFAWLILVLLCKLDSKAESYKDVSLSYLFLANNLQFIVKKVTACNLKELLGDEWVSNHTNKVKLYASNFESMAWMKVLSSLPEKNLQEMISPETARESFRKFNAAFEEAYRKLTSWTVGDGKLRDEMKLSIANKLLPRYGEFYSEGCEILIMEDGEDEMKKVVRFSPDDLGNYLSDLFHGSSSSGSSSSPSSSSSRSSPGCVPILSH